MSNISQLWIEQSSLKLHENSETDLPFGVKFVGFGLSQACVNVATHFEIHASYLQTSDVQISIKDPLSNFIQSSITKRSSEIWDVVYIPERIGTHEIVIKFGTGKSAVIFPNYNVNVFDPSKVKIKFKRQCFAHRITNFKVDINEAGCGSLEIVINKGAISSYAVEISKLVYKVYFVAEEIGTAIVEIWMNKITIPGTPIVLNVIEPSRIHLIGDLSTGLLNEQQTIRIIAPDLNADDLKCSITDPSNRPVASDYLNSSCKETICTFKPETVGNFTIALSAFGQQLLNSPYKMNVIAPDQAQINKLSDYIWLNIISEFEVDARSTGILNYDSLLVKINDGNVPCNVTSISEGQYLITFKPVSSIDHVIDVFYNNFRLKGTPHVCKVLTINDLKATGPGLVSSSVNQRASFSISSITQINPNDLNILITSHNKKLVEYEIQQSDEKIDVFYIPTIVGIHSIWLKIAGVNLSDSPFHVPVCDPSKVTVDINHDDFIVGKSFTFIVNAKDAGHGKLEILVTCDGKNIRNIARLLKNRINEFEIEFIPKSNLEHNISITFNSVSTTDSPFKLTPKSTPMIKINGPGVKYVRCNQKATFTITAPEDILDDLICRIIDPVQKDVNHEVIPEGNGNYKLSFTPTEIGQYRIFISYREIAAEHCPLYIEAYDINAIKLISIPKEINVGVDSYFNIDYTLAGSVKAKIKIHQQEPDFDELVYSLTTDASGGLQTVKFVPAKVGLLKVDVTLNNEHIKGSPFNIIVGNNYTPKVSGDGLICGIVNQLCEFVVSSCGSDASLRVKIEGDNGVSPWAEILKCSNSTFIIRYLPDGVGYYRISIDLGDFSIRGSPFTVPVVNPKKVRLISDYFAYVNGMSVYMLAVNKTNIIEVTTENAGPGELSALIKSSKQKIPYEIIPISPVKQQISFMPVQVGPHEIQIFWSGFPIDNSKPIKAHVDTQIQSNDRIKVYGTIFCEAFVNTDNEFIIDATDSDKLAIPIVTVKHEESKNSELPVKIHQIEKNIFKCHFRPLMTGIHNMFIMWLGHSISQSPIAFKVYDSNSANFRYKASIIDYDKSHEGIVNKPISFYVEIISAKPGQLVTKCTDPNGVPLMTNIIKKSDNLCSVKIIPTSEGIHDFEALFDGSQIDGSPLKFQVKNKALLDPSKIKVTGPGIQDGFLENFDSSFECDTKEAGRGHLTVRIRGPKGAFRVNMQKCEENPRIIYCSYNPVEAGVYVISIQWADQEIPGSPYTVQICHADSSDIPTIAIT